MWNVQSSRKISLLLTFKSNYCCKSIKVCMWTFKRNDELLKKYCMECWIKVRDNKWCHVWRKTGKKLLGSKMKNVKMIVKYWHSWWCDVWGFNNWDNLIIINLFDMGNETWNNFIFHTTDLKII